MALALAGVLLPCLPRPAAAQPAAEQALPAAAARPIDFAADVKPILQASCARCHARGRERGGFSIETRERLLAGGDNGAVVVPGDSAASELVRLVAGLDPESVMPKKGSRLTAEQVGILRAWIDQGLAWDPAISFARAPARNLAPRRPALPEGSAATHPVDRLLAGYFAAHEAAPARLAGDRRFARRAYLDAIGVLPTALELRAYLDDRRPGKRARLVRALLADDRRYAEHWLSFWNDLLRNDYQGTGYIDGGREQISAWLYAALARNMPYDRFVAELVNPEPGAEGFTKGIVWRGVVNASQTPQMQAAQNVSQVFMGVNLKCASCHDSFINDWQLADGYGLAACTPTVRSRWSSATSRPARPRRSSSSTRNSERSMRGPRAPNASRQLARILVGPANGRLPRTIVNRLWARFMGRGLVEPSTTWTSPRGTRTCSTGWPRTSSRTATICGIPWRSSSAPTPMRARRSTRVNGEGSTCSLAPRSDA